MSKEAKIGMLTGLLVIVLIGVLLSEYLGNNGSSTPAGKGMTAETYGDNFRRQQREPVGVPGLIRESPINNALVTTNDTDGGLPRVLATDGGGSAPGPVINRGIGPVINNTAVAVDAGKADGMLAKGDQVAKITQDDLTGLTPGGVKQAVYVTIDEAKKLPVDGSKVVTTMAIEKPVIEKVAATQPTTKTEVYTIAKGDTLTIIAKKYYKAATPALIKKIVAANKPMLKDETTGLVVGKKLNLPDVPVAKAEIAKSDAKSDVKSGDIPGFPMPMDTSKKSLVVKPGMEKALDPKLFEKVPGEGKGVEIAKETKAGEKPAASTYTVAKGDTLERIAKKISTKDYLAVMKQIRSSNGLKDDAVLQVGQKLKVPAASPASGTVVASAH